MIKKIVLGTLAFGSMAFAVDLSTVTGETVGVFSKDRGDSTRPLIYKAENFHEMATVPGFSLGAPSGLVSSYGVAFMGLSGKKSSSTDDGALAFGMGFGDSDKIGGSASIGIGSVDPRDGGSFNRGNLNLSFGHHFREYHMGWSVGVAGIDLWHANSLDGDNGEPSFYTAVTKLYPNDLAPVAITAGFGNNGYADVTKDTDRKDEIGGFGSVAVYVMPQVSLILDYTTGILGAGASIVPFPQYPVTVSVGATNLNKQGTDDKVSAIGSIAAAYVF